VNELLLKIENLSKSFGENQVLKDINISINKGEIIGLVGENGAGKSTLMKTIFGMPVIRQTGGYGGSIKFEGKEIDFKSPFDALEAGIGMVHQEFSLIPGFEATENIVLNRESTKNSFLEVLFGERIKRLDNLEMEARAGIAVGHLGVKMDPKTIIKEMPVAHKQFTEIAREIERENTKLLVLDEPTAVLTESEAEILLQTMKRLANEGISIIFITHRLNEIMEISDKVVVLRDGILIKEVETSKTSAHEITEWMIGRSFSEAKTIKKVTKNEEILLQLDKFWVDMPGETVKKLDLKVYKGEILGIGGMAGQGKLGIANGIMGLYTTGGKLTFKGKEIELNKPKLPLENGIFLVSEDRKGVGLLLDGTIEDNIAYPAIQIKNEFIQKYMGGLIEWIDEKNVEKNALEYIKKLEIRCINSKQTAGELSGGNQQKVCMAKAFTMKPELLMVSEPTRGIDVGAKKLVLETLREYNQKYGTTIIITSSELEELRGLSDRIVIITEGKVAGILPPEADIIKFGELMVGIGGTDGKN